MDEDELINESTEVAGATGNFEVGKPSPVGALRRELAFDNGRQIQELHLQMRETNVEVEQEQQRLTTQRRELDVGMLREINRRVVN